MGADFDVESISIDNIGDVSDQLSAGGLNIDINKDGVIDERDVQGAKMLIKTGAALTAQQMAARGNRSGSQAFAPDTIREQVGEDEDGNPIYKYFQQGVTYDKNTNAASTYKVEVGEPLTAQGETIEQKREQDAKAAAKKESMTEQAAIDVKTANDNVEKLAFAEKRIKFLSETGKLNAKNLDLLKTTSINRKANIEKAKSFRDALQSGLRSSGVGRQAANFLPIGVWTDQGSFDEIFNSFALLGL